MSYSLRTIIKLELEVTTLKLWGNISEASLCHISLPYFPYKLLSLFQDIPFPSVTICHASSTLWAGLRQYFNEIGWTKEYRQTLSRSFKSFVRLWMKGIDTEVQAVRASKEDLAYGTVTDLEEEVVTECLKGSSKYK